MGLRMASIHDPSVPSSTPQPAENGTAPLMELIKQKDSLEEELSALAGVLQSHGVNMNTSLTTFDGYPRDDIDVAQIRTTRARIIHLKNDHKALMSRIEKGLHEHHAAYQQSIAAGATVEEPSSRINERSSNSTVPSSGDTPSIETPFAKVNSVVAGSPADDAGLEAGDKILRFGEANLLNHNSLRKVSDVVQRSLGRKIAVKVQRKSPDGTSTTKELELTPRSNWGGRGALGCHVVPLD